MDLLILVLKTILFRPYVFVFLFAFLFCATQLIGWPRTWRFWVISWTTAYIGEWFSTRTGIPFGRYEYTGSTIGQELYLSNIPFMASLSFSYLLYSAYCVALCFLLPIEQARTSSRPSLRRLRFDRAARTSLAVLLLTSFLFALIDIVIDPVALRGDRWFLGRIYSYAEPGFHFGVPLANYVGWVGVGMISLSIYFPIDRRLPDPSPHANCSTTYRLLLGVGLYYAVLIFILGVTFWIGEWRLGISGVLICLPLSLCLALSLTGYLHPRESCVVEQPTSAGSN